MIRLHSLSMSHFRGVREGTIQGLTDVNLLIGRNNSGKTTVMEAITRLAFGSGRIQEDILGRPLHRIWSAARNEGELTTELWYKMDLGALIVLEAHIGDRERVREGKEAICSLNIRHDQNGWSAQPGEKYVEGGLVPAQVISFLRGVTVYRPADATNRQIELRLWPQLIATRRDKPLTSTLNSIFGLEAEALQLLPDGRLMVLLPQYSVPLDVQGDGTRGAARALMVLTMLSKTMFLLEEPECHQHPGSLERFALAICQQARAQEVQLVISTHSAECVRAFLKAAGQAGGEAAVFHLTLEQGRQEARRLDTETVETLQSTGVDVRFLDLYA